MPSISQESNLSNSNINASFSRKELDAICRRNQSIPPSSLRQALAPVPEMSTPGSGPLSSTLEHFTNKDDLIKEEDNTMTHSRLFQEFSNRQNRTISHAYAPISQQQNISCNFLFNLKKNFYINLLYYFLSSSFLP